MIAILILALAQTPQEDEAKRARDAVFGLPGFEQKAASAPAEPVQEAPPASFMTPRGKRTVDDYRALLDGNVFSPPRKKDSPKSDTPKSDTPKPPETKTKAWTVTGIVYNGIEKRYEALVEDSLTKESKFMKEGDSFAGAQITAVTFDQVSYKKGETTGALKLKEKLEEVVTGGGASAPLKPEEQAEVDKVRERMKKRNRRETVPDEAEEDAENRKKPK